MWGDNQWTSVTLCQRLWPRIKQMESGCWEWQGHIARGYGQIRFNGRMCRPHRLVYALLRGPLEEGLVIDHLCRNRRCCNPAHLEQVTERENILRGVGATATNAKRAHCKNGHEFTPENTYNRLGSRPGRGCRACKRARDSRRWYKRKLLDALEKRARGEASS